eukprot:tig00000870_g5133.t1
MGQGNSLPSFTGGANAIVFNGWHGHLSPRQRASCGDGFAASPSVLSKDNYAEFAETAYELDGKSFAVKDGNSYKCNSIKIDWPRTEVSQAPAEEGDVVGDAYCYRGEECDGMLLASIKNSVTTDNELPKICDKYNGGDSILEVVEKDGVLTRVCSAVDGSITVSAAMKDGKQISFSRLDDSIAEVAEEGYEAEEEAVLAELEAAAEEGALCEACADA